MTKELIFTIGIPGAGKSTYLRDKYPKVSTDDIRRYFLGDVNTVSVEGLVFNTAEDIVVNLFEKYDTVYLSATMVENLGRSLFLSNIQERVHWHDVKFKALVFPIDPEESKRRIQADLDNGIDRADSIDIVDEYHQYYLETIRMIETGNVEFEVEYVK